MNDDSAWMDATAQAEAVRAGDVTPVELVEAAIARIEKLNPQLNAVIHRLDEKALTTAADAELPAGPFRGVPFLVKDGVCHTAGDPFHCGMQVLKDIDWHEQTDTWLAERFRAAGFVFVGKTNLPELASSVTTEPLAYGATHNPWNLDYSPGGSSGGAAAAVAAGIVAVAHGNDMGGSIRVPSSACGLVGLKPTRARTTLGPDFGEFWGPLTHEHVLTRSVRDTAAVLDATAGPGPGDPYSAPVPDRSFASEVGADPGRLRIGFRTMRIDGAESHPECVARRRGHGAVTRGARTRCLAGADRRRRGAGHRLPRDLRVGDHARPRPLERAHRPHARAVGSRPDQRASPPRWAEASRGRSTLPRSRPRRGGHGRWRRGGRTGTTSSSRRPCRSRPARLGELAPDVDDPMATMPRMGNYAMFTSLFNITGQPAISLPLHWAPDGLPIGVQLVAAYGREDVLIRIASQIEQARPWADRRPPVCV